MKKSKTLLQMIQGLEREELVRCATNLRVDFDPEWSVYKIRKAYAEHILSHPRELLLMLPQGDIGLLEETKSGGAKSGSKRLNNHLTPIMVEYGMAELEADGENINIITIAEDLRQALLPHIGWAKEDVSKALITNVETIAEGLANLLGVVNQGDIIGYLKRFLGRDNDQEMRTCVDYACHYSLLLNSMEWVENPDTAEDKDIQFVSRYAWDDKREMIEFINEHSRGIDTKREFTLEDLVYAQGGGYYPIITNPKLEVFKEFLTHRLGLDKDYTSVLCFELWYNKVISIGYKPMEVHYVGYGLGACKKEITDSLADEAMARLADFANNMPLWQLWGFTATDYPVEAFISDIPTEKPLGQLIRSAKKKYYKYTDFLDGKPAMPDTSLTDGILPSYDSPSYESPSYDSQFYEENDQWEGLDIGRNDPCPCGSGKKYKKCHGRN